MKFEGKTLGNFINEDAFKSAGLNTQEIGENELVFLWKFISENQALVLSWLKIDKKTK